LQNYSKWSIVDDDPDFGDFLGPKFPSFYMGDLEEDISGKQLLGLLNIVPARDLAISSYFSCSEN